MMAEQVAVRTRFFDRALLAAASQRCDQVVLLACGMDARAFRLAWPPGTKVFELDFADVLAFKATVLDDRGATAACHRVEVATDLRQDWAQALAESGFSPERPAAWLAEGILYALPPKPPTCSSTGSPPSPPQEACSPWTTRRTRSCSAPPARTSPPNSSGCGEAALPRTWMPGLPGAAGSLS